ncbi:alpha/beta hydrolase [Klenkia taihuensis]|uniref:Acetyl esterase/lipase n=1 Tax=Klenkia taihuensis TaxID=1225127 RepID=A0A1I1Q9C1_9ACTN|nr:alpha/beta hydrolase [Klenkia taihuensis]GHE08226.1 alpha/beta hydrolase [Klenkia taihuensis]SFD15823.1 Acetyl esterase/lipase [Klenkia taihuensis]
MTRASETFDTDVAAAMAASAFTARGAVDMTDRGFITAARARGPVPDSVEGVDISETTLPASDGHQVTVRVYRPTTPHPNRPAYVLFHGGGWSFGSLETEHPRCVELTRRCGAVGVGVDFRMAPDVPAETILDDCWSAVRWTAAREDVDPTRVVVTGSSAGGALALSMAQIGRDRGDVVPALALALYPNTDDREHPSRIAPAFPVITGAQVAQVVANVRQGRTDDPAYVFPNRTADLAGLCPTFLVVAGNDPLRDEALEYARRLVDADVPVELHLLPGVPHAFDGIAPQGRMTRTAYDLMCAAVDRAVG